VESEEAAEEVADSVPAKEIKKPKIDMDNALGHEEDHSGTSDSDHSCSDRELKIREKRKFFNCKKHLAKFIRRTLGKIEAFDRIECFGNSYDESSCRYIAELIEEKGSDEFYYADFSNMFVTRRETLPPSMKLLIDSISTKPIQQLYIHDNAFGPIGVAQFKDFL